MPNVPERPLWARRKSCKFLIYVFYLIFSSVMGIWVFSLGTNHVLANSIQVRFLKFCWIGFFKNEFLVLFLEACSFLFNFIPLSVSNLANIGWVFISNRCTLCSPKRKRNWIIVHYTSIVEMVVGLCFCVYIKQLFCFSLPLICIFFVLLPSYMIVYIIKLWCLYA